MAAYPCPLGEGRLHGPPNLPSHQVASSVPLSPTVHGSLTMTSLRGCCTVLLPMLSQGEASRQVVQQFYA